MISDYHVHLFEEVRNHEGFNDVIVAAAGEEIYRHLQVRIAGHEDEGDLNFAVFDEIEQIYSGFAGQVDIRNNQVEAGFTQPIDGRIDLGNGNSLYFFSS